MECRHCLVSENQKFRTFLRITPTAPFCFSLSRFLSSIKQILFLKQIRVTESPGLVLNLLVYLKLTVHVLLKSFDSSECDIDYLVRNT